MRLKINWRDNRTGQTGEYSENREPSLDDYRGLPFDWAEGNYACDCNRELLFLVYPRGGKYDDAEGLCGDGRFEILSWSWEGEG